MAPFRDFSVAILAGGRSKRMGVDKATARLNGTTLIEHVAHLAASLEPFEMFIIAQGSKGLDIPVYADIRPEHGPLGAIETALKHMQTEQVLILACDMPFIKAELLRALLGSQSVEKPFFDAIVTAPNNLPQGLPGLYHRAALGRVEERLTSDDLSLTALLQILHVNLIDTRQISEIDPDLTSFINVNTPDDLERIALTRD